MSVPITIQTAWPLVLMASLPLLVWWAGSSTGRLARRHLVVAISLRSLVIIALALALTRPQWIAQSGAVSVVYALDVSRSVSSEFIESAINWIEQADREGAPSHARYLAFADRPVMLKTPGDVRNLAVSEGRAAAASAGANAIDQSASNIEQALDAALLELEPLHAKRIVLLTDGNQNAGEAWRVLPRLARANVRVYPIPARIRDGDAVWIGGIEAPTEIHSGEPASVTVRIFAAVETPARVLLKSATSVLGTRKLRLNAGMNDVAFEVRLTKAGLATMSAEVIAGNERVLENNRMQRSMWVKKRPRVLYIEGGPGDDARYLANALETQGIETVAGTPDSMPDSVSGLTDYDALILSDVEANRLTPRTMQTLESYVRDFGGGLLFTSGQHVYGEQGYTDTAIENVLPVQFRAQEKRKDLALVIAMDRSYSMKGRKMEMAKEAARAALDLLEEQHRFAVVAFDSQTQIAVPMQYVRSRRKAQDLISRIQASGQTNIYPALGIVYRLMEKIDSRAKHVILLSDGDTHPADFEALLKRMTEGKIVVSTVAVGADAAVSLMSDIARWGKGRAYVAQSADSIPQIFIEETERAVRSSLLEESFTPVVVRRSRAFQGLDVDALPQLRGLVGSKARDHAEILLTAPSGAPLLVRWQFGLGRATAFMSDVKNRWASGWLNWPGYGRFWAQQVREVMRRDSGEAMDFRVERESGDAVIGLSMLGADGRYQNGLVPQVRVTRSDGTSTLMKLDQTGAGTYRQRVPVNNLAPAERFELVDGPGLPRQVSLRAGVRLLHQNFPAEYRALPPDVGLLSALASATGGKLAPSIPEIFAPQGDASSKSILLWPWLAALALVAYLLDIAVRRTPLAYRWLSS